VEELYIVNMITKKRVHETNMGHRIISPDKVLLDNKEIINQILEKISKTYNICIEDAAFVLESAFGRLNGGRKDGYCG